MEAERKENRFFRMLQNSFWKLIWLNLLYLVCCLPIITVGPATAAMVYVLQEIEGERITFVFRDFLEGMKKNWRQALPVGLLHTGAMVMDGCAVWYYVAWLMQRQDAAVPMAAALVIAVILGVILLISGPYLYLQIVNCQLSSAAIAKNAVLLALIELRSSFLVLAGNGAFLLLLLSPTLFISVYFYPISLILLALWGGTIPYLFAVYRLRRYVMNRCISA